MLSLLLLLACGNKHPETEPPVPDTTREEVDPPEPEDKTCTLSSCLPEGWTELPLGTPYATFQEGHPEAPADDIFSFRIEVTLDSPEAQPQQTTLYFDVDLPEQPLYEFIFEYADGTDVSEIATALWGEPNEGEEWALPVDGDVTLKAWTFESKLVITAPWEGTEWNPGDEEE
ncbi:MAG: hypothetical protein H6741_24485 [Alphaproteobacteria bacterium]|nr:hypothetical protein [Alphaproteobacteria bacterium]